ncbi:uncharacterized protein LLCC_1267 [Lactococcus cremoris]|jgi:DNA-binding XRE family transcriptional regulator|uniref:HTH cro/C1-type domain-containing protein n=1 Tax=Lactococcus lactis subsp. cremoris TaxID=1359 RepID=A0AAD1NJL7_LACLC|nr:XRE family transcriptional regulator [Lactococcus cremoris]MDU1630896.1 XRE family transcriptional regulator [Lactococcus lactis]BBC75646.1 uncharacterized protein LLCC_1267 [Lactococcus cremoris]BCO04312.1 hypothetical protein LLG32_24060 [Lactococcus cremoris]BCO07167.1 hypothetical protein LLC_24070 [Lactococcus cremoris]
MKIWTNEQAKSLRERRAGMKLTQIETCKLIGIGEKTLRSLETGPCQVKQSIYIKVLEFISRVC